MTVQTISVVDAVERQIKERILEGAFPPGLQIPSEKSLGETFGVSRLPIREAISRLKAVGVLRSRQGKGVFVESEVKASGLSDALLPLFLSDRPDMSQKLFETRSFLEGAIAGQAAIHGTEDEIRELGQFANFPSSATATAEAFADYDSQFHDHLATMAHNEFLLYLFRALTPYIRNFLVCFGRNRTVRKAALERHSTIIEAVAKRDEQAAREASQDHLLPCFSALEKSSAVVKARHAASQK